MTLIINFPYVQNIVFAFTIKKIIGSGLGHTNVLSFKFHVFTGILVTLRFVAYGETKLSTRTYDKHKLHDPDQDNIFLIDYCVVNQFSKKCMHGTLFLCFQISGEARKF